MKNKTFNRLFAITVSKNYSDELSVMLDHNAKFFDRWYIGTQEDDIKTIELIKSKNLDNVEIVFYPLVPVLSKKEDEKSILKGDDLEISYPMYATDDELKKLKALEHPVFDKGGSILTMQKHFLTKQNPTSNDLLALIDSDIILPDNFIEVLQTKKFEKDTLYGTLRNDFLFYSDFLKQKNYRPFKQMEGAGFIQLHQYDPTKLCKRTISAEWVDHEFRLQFPNVEVFTELTASHMGLQGMNWNGKKGESFIFDDKRENIINFAEENKIPTTGDDTEIKSRILKTLTAQQIDNASLKVTFPQFMIPGFIHSGSDHLKNILSNHHAISFGSRSFNDIEFFASSDYVYSDHKLENYNLRKYLGHFQRDGTVWGDYSNTYFGRNWNYTINKMQNVFVEKLWKNIPKVKFIVMLRDPVKRAISEYNHNFDNFPASFNWNWGCPGKSFYENIEFEIEEINKLKSESSNWNYEDDKTEGRLLLNGYYAPVLKHFEKKLNLVRGDTMKVVIYEELLEHPHQIMEEIFDFLNVEHVDTDFDSIRKLKTNEVSTDKETETLLKSFYEPLNKELYEFIGRKVSAWN